jgi:hypothetical protein
MKIPTVKPDNEKTPPPHLTLKRPRYQRTACDQCWKDKTDCSVSFPHDIADARSMPNIKDMSPQRRRTTRDVQDARRETVNAHLLMDHGRGESLFLRIGRVGQPEETTCPPLPSPLLNYRSLTQ